MILYEKISMTILKFFKNFMFLLEIKRKTPDFPITHTRKAKPQVNYYERLKKERKEEIDKWLDKHSNCKTVVISYIKLTDPCRSYNSFNEEEEELLKR